MLNPSSLISRHNAGIKVGMTIFDEKYKVVAVESHRLIIRGILSGDVLVIKTVPELHFGEEAMQVGQVITLSDPATEAPN